ncbi:hypothetical protein PybrP1_008693 [[Pythium] brassicae (nom. inval.)]|nr:hypothetical protein PybrP1_008693 [[Pythium] brassicae (nom. inval.)]
MQTLEEPLAAEDARAFVENALVATFCSECASLMTRELELVLRTRLTDGDARCLMFCPTTRCWALFYLKHARNWALVIEFVLLDGLRVLTEQLLDADVQVRGQALDCFVQITSHTAFDWFQDPCAYIDRALHTKMAALAAPGAAFLPSLLCNIRAYDPLGAAVGQQQPQLPGGTFVLLQVLAFYLSWLRKFYALPHNEMRLSRELLALLRDWRVRTQTDEPAELALAQQVYDDFRRWPAVDDGAEGQRADISTDNLAIGGVSLPPADSCSVFSRALVRQLLESSSDDVTAEENEAAAVACCSDAIDAGACLLDAHLLRATALAQRVERSVAAAGGSRRKVSVECLDAGQRSLDDCAAVRRLDDANVAARRLQLRVFAALDLWADAVALLSEWDATTAPDALAAKFLPDDVAFFSVQRERAAERLRAQVDEDARQRRLSALRLAKQDEIFRAILKRDRVDAATASTAPLEQPHAVEAVDDSEVARRRPKCSELIANESGAGPSLATTKARANKRGAGGRSGRAKDPQTARICRGRAFARMFHDAAADRDALSALLKTTPPATLSDALNSALSDDQLLLLFDALASLAAKDAAPSAKVALGLLTRSARFRLAVEMAGSDELLEKLRGCADANSEAAIAVTGDGVDAGLRGSANGSACA